MQKIKSNISVESKKTVSQAMSVGRYYDMCCGKILRQTGNMVGLT